MELKRSHKLAAGLLAAVWLLVVGWQVEEHLRVVEAAKSDLRSRSHEIAGTLSAVTRALRFRGALFQDRLEPVLSELVSNRTSVLVKLLYVGLLNTDGDPVTAAGDTNLFSREIPASGELWSDSHVTFVLPVEGASVRLLKDGRLVGEAASDNYGDFKFDKLDEDSGRYVVEISANGRAKTVEAQLGASVNLGEIRI